jgi:hypothetical protein
MTRSEVPVSKYMTGSTVSDQWSIQKSKHIDAGDVASVGHSLSAIGSRRILFQIDLIQNLSDNVRITWSVQGDARFDALVLVLPD